MGLVALALLVATPPSPHLVEGWGGKVSAALGLALFFLGVLGRLWATQHIGGRKSATLVDSGPYSLCRHPLYLFSLSLFLGLGLRGGNLYFLALLALYFPIQYIAAVKAEEAALSDSFGESHRAYRGRVPLVWPSGSWDPGVSRSPPVRVMGREARGMALAFLALLLLDHLAGRL